MLRDGEASEENNFSSLSTGNAIFGSVIFLMINSFQEPVVETDFPYMKDLSTIGDNNSSVYGEHTDVYLIGQMIYFINDGLEFPFQSKSQAEAIEKVKKGEYELRSNMDLELRFLMNMCLQADPKKRLSLNRVIEYWMVAMNTKPYVESKITHSSTHEYLPLNEIEWIIQNHKATCPKKEDDQLMIEIRKSQGIETVFGYLFYGQLRTYLIIGSGVCLLLVCFYILICWKTNSCCFSEKPVQQEKQRPDSSSNQRQH